MFFGLNILVDESNKLMNKVFQFKQVHYLIPNFTELCLLAN